MPTEVHFFVNGQKVDSIELEDNTYKPDKHMDTFMLEYGWGKKLKDDDTVRVKLVMDEEDKRTPLSKRKTYHYGGK